MWKRLCLESCYMYLWKWKIFSNYYGWFCYYLCDDVIKSYDKEIKTISTNFDEMKVTCKTQDFCVLLAFL